MPPKRVGDTANKRSNPWQVGLAALLGVLLILVVGQRLVIAYAYPANTRALLARVPEAPKVWAHRVNSTGALHEAKSLFAGVEADLVFDSRSRRFDVRHPPAPGTGLTLDEYLAQSADHPQLHLWLDWKNPTRENVVAAVRELDRLDAKYRIRGRAMVETPSSAVFDGIAAVSDARFVHGYYLPTERGLAAIEQGPHAMARFGADVRATLARGRFDAVTYDARMQPFVDQQLDAFLQQRQLRRFSWDMRINSGDPLTRAGQLSRIVRPHKLDALLISFPSRYRV